MFFYRRYILYVVKAVDSFQIGETTEYRATFREASIEWLGGSSVNTTGEQLSHLSDTFFNSGPVFCSLAIVSFQFYSNVI